MSTLNQPGTSEQGSGTATARLPDFVPGDEFFDAPGEPFGSERIALSIGPLRMSLTGLTPSQVDQLRDRFSPFVVPESGPASGDDAVTVRLCRAPVDAFLRFVPGVPEFYRIGVGRSGGRSRFWSYEFAGWIDARERQGLVSLVQESGVLFDRGLENFLRIMTANLILDRGGFLLHGSGVVRDGRAYVFFGPSGSGKTTVTDLSPDDTILSDDLTLVVPGASGFEAAGIPFGMAHHHVPDTNGSFPIASLNRLVQSRDTRREPMPKARAMAEVAASLPFVAHDPARTEQILSVVDGLLERVPVHRLHFRKDPSFWDEVVTG